jgi:hypothetical protein
LECSVRNAGVIASSKGTFYSLCRTEGGDGNYSSPLLTNENAPGLREEATCQYLLGPSGNSIEEDCIKPNEERFPVIGEAGVKLQLCGCSKGYFYSTLTQTSAGCQLCPVGNTCEGGFLNGLHVQPAIAPTGKYVENNNLLPCLQGSCQGRGNFLVKNNGVASICCDYFSLGQDGMSESIKGLIPPGSQLNRKSCQPNDCPACPTGSTRVLGKCKPCSGLDWLGYECPGGGQWIANNPNDAYYQDALPRLCPTKHHCEDGKSTPCDSCSGLGWYFVDGKYHQRQDVSSHGLRWITNLENPNVLELSRKIHSFNTAAEREPSLVDIPEIEMNDSLVLQKSNLNGHHTSTNRNMQSVMTADTTLIHSSLVDTPNIDLDGVLLQKGNPDGQPSTLTSPSKDKNSTKHTRTWTEAVWDQLQAPEIGVRL